MKRLLFIAVLAAVALTAAALPARRGLTKTITLADGSEVQAELRGDEFGHFWLAEDGRAFVKDGGTYVLTSAEAVAAEAMARRAVADVSSKRRRVTLGGSHDAYEGQKNCLVILVNFANKSFESGHDNAFFTDLCNKENFTDGHNIHSVHDYFYDQSYGKLDITFDVAGPITLANNYAYYGGTSGSDKAYEMVLEACKGAEEAGIDFSKYDWDGDGEADEVFVLYAGYNAASYFDDEGLVWPHMWYIEYSDASCPVYDGVKINTYACSSELSGDGLINGIGAMCHEFSHCLGLPDAYDTNYENFGMSFWSVMDSGCYNGDDAGYVPAGYTSYERMYCGWLTPEELTDETEVSGMKGLTEGGEAYIIYNKGTRNEYYLLENRSNYDYDAGLYGYGLLVLHLDYNSTVWKNNVVNTYAYYNDHERYTFIAADNDKSLTTTSLANDVYPSSGNNRLDNTSTPAAETFNLNTDGTQLMNISITNIAKADDGTISFRFYPAGTDPEHGNKPDGAVFYESFDYCAGTGGNDGVFGGTGVGAATFLPDNSDWTYNAAHGGDQCAKFGSNTQAANIVTPTFTIDGETVFSFKAAPLTALVAGVLTVSVETGDATLSGSEFSIEQGDWNDVSFTLDGTGDVSLRIKETSGIGQFFMDEAAAVPASYSAIRTIAADGATTSKGVYSLGGVRLGGDLSTLKKGIYIVDGKKYVIK
ncbi:MAG: M6 family metalloprotease domain-containing protein [Prevotella sp.]|nr:M6 family metalloprotease domain-containing protein [Prevotella sp.]